MGDMITISPGTGENLVRYVGDPIRFTLQTSVPDGQAWLRTNLGRAAELHAEIVREYHEELARWGKPSRLQQTPAPPIGCAWRDLPMHKKAGGWEIDLHLNQAGFFNAKAYFVDASGRQHWPQGPNTGICVHPTQARCGNTIYCAFARQFGPNKTAISTANEIDSHLPRLDKLGYAVIPPSGKLRDLVREFPHIFETLNCRVLHLLPVTPTPTTYARFGRFGSPYAVQDLTAIDPALVEFDRRTTGIDQFKELTHAAHARGAQVLLDIVINHTGWGSTLQENHPDWFLREHNGLFASPGAWGTVWEDLVELDHRYPFSWEYLSEVFLTWCRRGVDGFRCDAGYKIPTPAWRYIIARVRQEFPDALFLLEGLGGAWEATSDLLTHAGMQWAYSELFQNYAPIQVSGYLDHSIAQSAKVGTLVHYSETHDNERLAAKGKAWSLVRNQLCALTSHNGAFGFTNGVEWLASERVNVHSARGLSWGNPENIVPELQVLNDLLCTHPTFFDGAKLTRLSPNDSQIYALKRESAQGSDTVIALINLSAERPGSFLLPRKTYEELGSPSFDLLRQGEKFEPAKLQADLVFQLEPGQARCLAVTPRAVGLEGDRYRLTRAQHSWLIRALGEKLEPEKIGPHNWSELVEFVEENPKDFLASLDYVDAHAATHDLLLALRKARAVQGFPQVIEWSEVDLRRVTPLPPNHWLLICDEQPFRAAIAPPHEEEETTQSVQFGSRHYAWFAPRTPLRQSRKGPYHLYLERFGGELPQVTGKLIYLAPKPGYTGRLGLPVSPRAPHPDTPRVLLTNGRGAMARLCVDLGGITSKYDCVLGANLHPSIPVDRHVFVKRLRLWANADRFISPLDGSSVTSFQAGPPARWEFSVIRGDSETATIELTADMIEGSNTTVFRLRLLRPVEGCDLRITARFDIEDRNFHTETRGNSGADFHFNSNTRKLTEQAGFIFAPAADRQVKVFATRGEFHPAVEWTYGIPHPVEQTRGQTGQGDAYSPGWFDLPLTAGESVLLVATAEPAALDLRRLEGFEMEREKFRNEILKCLPDADDFGRQLALGAQAYVVRREKFKTIIAGYPWFLDWGRDSLICARGLLAAGMIEEVRQLLITFGRFEQNGTLPNTIHGEDASNRDTSDAPLWYGVVAAELADRRGPEVLATSVDATGRTILDVLRGIAAGNIQGTPNGIRMDAESGLIWSPSHFTWMDTNYPAGTPREGYPIEIQALWIRLLRVLAKAGARPVTRPWEELADLAKRSLQTLFWSEKAGWHADCLRAAAGVPARRAELDDALRSNVVFPISFGQLPLAQARQTLEAVRRYLVIPGALRSLAPLPVNLPLPIHATDWRLLNNPHEPYAGRYEGDEDTRRKPAYHNGTGWTWPFPAFCEALMVAYEYSEESQKAALAYLASVDQVLQTGCIGQIPEIMDGDAPHQARGCDAQSWGMTEALRLWEFFFTAAQSKELPLNEPGERSPQN